MSAYRVKLAGEEWHHICDCGFNAYLDARCKCEDCRSHDTLPLEKCPNCGEHFKVLEDYPQQ